MGSPRWSPSGSLIAFDSRLEGHSDIYLISSEGGKTVRLTSHPAQDGEPAWSRDGTTLYFASDRSGQTEIWKKPAKNGRATQVTVSGGTSPQISYDGKTLYFKKDDELWRKSLSSGREYQVLEQHLMIGPSFAVVNNGLFFIPKRTHGSRDCICFYDSSRGVVSTVKTTEHQVNWGLTASPDGLQVLFPQVDHIHSDLVVAEDFQ